MENCSEESVFLLWSAYRRKTHNVSFSLFYSQHQLLLLFFLFFLFFAFAALLDSSFLIVVCRACHILHFNKSELWPRCLRELVSCKHLIAFVEEGVLNVLLCSDELITISPLRLQ